MEIFDFNEKGAFCKHGLQNSPLVYPKGPSLKIIHFLVHKTPPYNTFI